MKLNEVRTFVAVARAGSVQTAAKQLHMTQSAVSRLVQRLELDLGATLFDRQAKPLALTHDGRMALVHGQRVLDAADALSEALAPAAAPRGVLRIGTAHALADLVAETPLDRLRSAFPDLTLQISVDWAKSLLTKLSEGALDAAVITLVTDDMPKTDLPARRIGKEAVRIVGATKLVPTAPTSLRALNEIGWVIQPDGCGYRTALAQALDQAGAGPPKIIVEAFGKHLQLSVIARGAGFGLLPERQIKALRSKRAIAVVRAPEFRASVSTWFVRRRHPARLSKPLDLIEQTVSTLVGA